MFAGYRHTGGMDHVGIDAASPQPPGQRLSPYRLRASPTRQLPALTNFARPTAIARPQYNAIVLHVRHEQPAQKAHDPQCPSPTRRPRANSCGQGYEELQVVAVTSAAGENRSSPDSPGTSGAHPTDDRRKPALGSKADKRDWSLRFPRGLSQNI